MRTLKLITFTSFLLTTACAYNPVIDYKSSTTPENVQQDIMECRNLAAETDSKVTGTSVGAGLGAAVGAVIAIATVMFTKSGQNVATMGSIGAGVGAVGGGMHGYIQADNAQIDVIRKCLTGRGYVVLK